MRARMAEQPDAGEAAPDLSVIVVNWNTREMTLACLRSLHAETRDASFETIVVDNGSHDGSARAIASEFPQVRLIAEKANHGFARANNIAAESARGKRLLLLNSDTVVLDRAVDRLLGFASAHPDARIWGGRTVFADGRVNLGSAWGRLTAWSAFCYATGLSRLLGRWTAFDPEAMRAWDRSDERMVDIVSGCFFLIDADLWRSLGGFDADFFMYAEEADLCARAIAAGARPRVTPAATIVHHGGGSAPQRSATLKALFRGKLALARKHLSPRSAAIVRASYTFVAASRAAALSATALVARSQRDKATTWRAVWSGRREWRG